MIFFDIDQTLLDNRYAEEAAVVALMREHEELFRDSSDPSFDRWRSVTETYFQRYLDGELTFQGQRRARLREMVADSVELSDVEADKLHLEYLKQYEANWRLFDDVIPCLEGLASFGLGVISNGDSEQQRRKLTQLKIAFYFSIVVVSSDIDISKPEAGIFQTACAKAGKRADECTYVGDRLNTDARGAAGAGMRGIWLNRSGDSSMGDVDTDVEMIRSLYDLEALLEGE